MYVVELRAAIVFRAGDLPAARLELSVRVPPSETRFCNRSGAPPAGSM
jgi:hypothetical protein